MRRARQRLAHVRRQVADELPQQTGQVLRFIEQQDDRRLIRIDGLGHAWTRKEVDTTEVMWQFFKSQRLP